MLHIILALLKIIGIFLLILLGILLFLVIAVLAAPITYRISGGWNDQLNLQGKIYWLYHIVGISIRFNDGGPEIGISLFGRGNGSESASQKKKAPGRKKKSKRRKRRKESFPETVESAEKPATVAERDSLETLEPDDSELDWDSMLDEELEKSQEQDWTEEPIGGKPWKDSSETKVFETEDFEKKPEDEAKPEDNHVLGLICRILDFLKQPPVKKLIGKLWRSIRRIFRHLRPSDLRLQAIIGTGDPASTGRIMELAAVLYAFYGDRVKIVSDFDEKVLEAEFTVRGWLVPGYLLIKLLGMALRILMNKECRGFYKEIKQSLK